MQRRQLVLSAELDSLVEQAQSLVELPCSQRMELVQLSKLLPGCKQLPGAASSYLERKPGLLQP